MVLEKEAEIEQQVCPFCHEKTVELIERELDVPFFGKTFLLSMSCSSCHFYKSDVEAAERKEPCKVTFTVESKEDMKVRIVKSAEATIKIPSLKMSVTPGPASVGYISNIEGVLKRFQRIVEDERNNAEDEEIKKRAKNILKKMWRVECGDEQLKIIIEDPSGNSAIISEKAERIKLK